MTDFIEIPFRQLSDDALQGVIEEYVGREGTDYGLLEYSFDEKVAQVRACLMTGRAVIVYDQQTQSCTLLLKD